MSARKGKVAPTLRSVVEAAAGPFPEEDPRLALVHTQQAKRELRAVLAVVKAAGDLSRLTYPADVWTDAPAECLGAGDYAAKAMNRALARLARLSVQP